MTGPCDRRGSRLLPSRSRPRASQSTARRLCSGLTACHGSRNCLDGRPLEPRFLYTFDLIEHDGEELRNLTFRKAALAWHTEAGIRLNEHIIERWLTVFAYACRLGAEGIVSKKVDSAYQQSGPAASGFRSAILPASPCSRSAVRYGTDEPQAARAGDDPPQGTKPPAARGARPAILMRRSIAQKAASRLHRVGHCILATLDIAAM
jgi:hypothetical protein